MAKIKYYKQETPYTCGAACLRMLLSRYRDFPEAMLAILSKTISLGTTPVDLARASEELGYEVDIYKHANLADLAGKVPCVVLINPGVILSDTPSSTGHFVVVKQVKGDEVIVNDPDMLFGQENKRYDLEPFIEAWRIMGAWLITIRGEKHG